MEDTALVIALAMVLGTMVMPAMAAAPEDGSITVNSPVVGATYDVYKVFDMTTNEAVDSFSYTIDTNSPFYEAVKAFADVTANDLKLTPITTEHRDDDPETEGNESYDKFLVTAGDGFKAKVQDFGKVMQAVVKAAAEAETPIDKATTKTATVDDSDQIKFAGLPLGYYLVNPTYPDAAYGTVTLGSGGNAKTFTTEDLVKNGDELADPLALTEDAKAKTDAYAVATVTDAYVDKYIADHHITTNKNGDPLDAAGKAEYKDDLLTEMKANAQTQVLAAFANQLSGSEADINVKEPIMVFLDSSQPDAVINEKNELDKWDVPVNPTADTEPGTPDHGEPNGGKNIVVQENPAYYADWSEAEIGESVHYQLRVNAMNFIRTGTDDASIKQVKEYFLADYQSGHMHFDADKKLKVTVWAGNDENDSQTGMTNVTKDATGAPVDALDYTAKSSTFFKNTGDSDLASAPAANPGIFGTNGTGIMVPWVKVSEANPAKPDPNYPIYTQTNVPKFEADGTTPIYKKENVKTEGGNPVPATTASGTVIPGQFVSVNDNIVDVNGNLLDENNQPIQDYDTYYVYSLYNSDVTIVVDYWMILDDDAIVDDPGNKNFAQYAWNPVDNKDNNNQPKKPENPTENDKPSEYGRVDEATVFTFALAWVKVDNKGNSLAGAEFQLPFYVKEIPDDQSGAATPVNGKTYVYAGTEEGTGLTNTVTTDDTGVITIKGVEQGVYSITETKAPEGFNKMTAPFNVEAKKSGDSVTTKTETKVYLDSQGNVTDEETTTYVTYNTDKDSYNNENASDDEEKSVPVYQFDPVVNLKGTELPSTGGIGTTIFYVVGAILVIGAGVILITRRRMDA